MLARLTLPALFGLVACGAATLVVRDCSSQVTSYLLTISATVAGFLVGLRVASRLGADEIAWPTLEQLAAQGRLSETIHRVQRAFEIEEIEDEGLHYFLELDDGRALFLSGQWLEPMAVSGVFPSTELTLVRDTELGFVDLRCGGEPFESELTLPHTVWDPWSEDLPEPGIVEGTTYDELKAAFSAKQAR